MATYHNRQSDGDETMIESEGETKMGDIAALLSLMQANKGMDIPGLLALCKDKGYDKTFGGEFMFIFVFLILFMWGGWGGLGPNRQNDVQQIAGTALNDIIGIHDRISAAQAANVNGFNSLTGTVTNGFAALNDSQHQSFNALGNQVNNGFNSITASTTAGFNTLDTKICQSIAEVISAVRNQGDRTYDATRTVGDAIRDCCCALNNKLDQVLCKTEGLYSHTSLVGERVLNAVDKQFCATDQKIDKLAAEMALGFERNACLITNTAKDQEMQRLQREVEVLKSNQNSAAIAQGVMGQMKEWMQCNFKGSSSGGASA